MEKIFLIMKLIFEKWNHFISEQEVKTKDELLKLLKSDKIFKINIDTPRGKTKKFGGLKKIKLKFDYGEWPGLINPADKMGWDLVIVPSADKDSLNLLPVGEINYRADDNIWDDVGKSKPIGVEHNTKIILGPEGSYTEEDKTTINKFFSNLIQFKPVIWYT